MTNTTSTTPSPSLPEQSLDDPRPVFAASLGLASEVVGAIAPGQLGLATPCDGFTVRELLGHLVDVMARIRLIGEGGDPMANGHVDPSSVPDDGWVELFGSRAEEVEVAWADDAVLDRTVVLPWATLPGRAALGNYINELTVHSWDLAVATGQQPAWDDEVVAIAIDAVHRALPEPNRQAMFEAFLAGMPEEVRPPNAPYGDAVEVGSDAPLIDQLVAWTGRRP